MACFLPEILFALLSAVGSRCHHKVIRVQDESSLLTGFYVEVLCRSFCAEHLTLVAEVSLWLPL